MLKSSTLHINIRGGWSEQSIVQESIDIDYKLDMLYREQYVNVWGLYISSCLLEFEDKLDWVWVLASTIKAYLTFHRRGGIVSSRVFTHWRWVMIPKGGGSKRWRPRDDAPMEYTTRQYYSHTVDGDGLLTINRLLTQMSVSLDNETKY